MSSLHDLHHPPAAARMGFLMDNIQRYCAGVRPHLTATIAPARFQSIMDTAAQIIHGVPFSTHWGDQISFLRSEPGIKYVQELRVAFDRHRLDATAAAEVQ